MRRRILPLKLLTPLLLAVCLPGAVQGALRVQPAVHYRIHTDLDESLAGDLSRRMDAMYEEYCRRFVDFKGEGSGKPLEVYLFQRQADYTRLTEGKYANTGGVFVAGPRNFLAAFIEGQGRDALRRTLQHEAFHQFAFNHISPALPIWLNEGLAQIFEEGIWTGQSFWVGQVPPRRLRQLREDIANRRLIRFTALMGMTPDQWASSLIGSPERGEIQYNQAWAMAQFLINSDDYRVRLINMLKLIHERHEPADAFAKAFSNNIKGFQDRFIEWAGSAKSTPSATLIEYQDVLGDMLCSLAAKGKFFNDIPEFRDATVKFGLRLQYTKGQIKWMTEPNPLIYFADPSGTAFEPHQLFFERRASAPLPDIVCRCVDNLQIRTRFHQAGKTIEHETLVESR